MCRLANLAARLLVHLGAAATPGANGAPPDDAAARGAQETLMNPLLRSMKTQSGSLVDAATGTSGGRSLTVLAQGAVDAKRDGGAGRQVAAGALGGL